MSRQGARGRVMSTLLNRRRAIRTATRSRKGAAMSANNRPKAKPKGDYATGYARPPKEHQFQPGQSGNKLGRPKSRLSIGEILLDERPATTTLLSFSSKRTGSTDSSPPCVRARDHSAAWRRYVLMIPLISARQEPQFVPACRASPIASTVTQPALAAVAI